MCWVCQLPSVLSVIISLWQVCDVVSVSIPSVNMSFCGCANVLSLKVCRCPWCPHENPRTLYIPGSEILSCAECDKCADVLKKTPCLYIVPEMRYWVVLSMTRVTSVLSVPMSLMSSRKPMVSIWSHGCYTVHQCPWCPCENPRSLSGPTAEILILIHIIQPRPLGYCPARNISTMLVHQVHIISRHISANDIVSTFLAITKIWSAFHQTMSSMLYQLGHAYMA